MNTHMCVVCDKTFNSKGNVSRHLKAIHGVQHAPKRGARHMGIICGICKKEFFDKATLTRHTAKVHKLSQHVVYDKNKNIRCEECKVAFSCKKQLIRHLVALHEFEEVYIQQEFMRIEDFREWLKCEEESNKVEYSRVNGKTIGKQFSRYLYECNRSGNEYSFRG
uniref:C2H2-type domain-containing protein n=1 Tax=Photinus pyralis TaxID=7054 RepID=A0A1Y1MKC3_PHOPY